ncbi:MAG TPA: hypothetical protein VE713_02085 [Pyrinomonadaceae bacterium]|nr:hypothetical protein [Pyrinomonadaceae bacterium]
MAKCGPSDACTAFVVYETVTCSDSSGCTNRQKKLFAGMCV